MLRSPRHVFAAGLLLSAAACRPRVSAEVPSSELPPSSTPVAVAPLVFVETEGDALGAAETEPELVVGASAADIAALREEGSSSAWDEKVAHILLRDFDTDGSGQLDSEVEIARIPCEVYRTLDEAVTGNRGGSSITAVYGFDYDYIWVGSAIGFDEAQRVVIAQAMQRCGLPFATPP